jgi:hypothetical protein
LLLQFYLLYLLLLLPLLLPLLLSGTGVTLGVYNNDRLVLADAELEEDELLPNDDM